VKFGALAVALLVMVFAAPPANAQTIEDQQWHLGALDVYGAQVISKGEGVVVAVVDSGVDRTRPDLADQLLPGTGFGTAAGTDGTDDQDGHGTAMATLIAGRAIDGGALGVAPKAKILPISVGADGHRFTTTSVSKGVRWAADHGAKVVNLSLTTEATLTPDLLLAVNYAFEKDAVVVAGTGNDGAVHVGAPANIRGVIAVSGTVQAGTPWPSSNTGPETVLAAPAQEIVTAVPLSVTPSGYAAVDGTSASTALVSGVAALVRAKYPSLSAANVVNRLIGSAIDMGATGRDDVTGFGLVNPLGALTKDMPNVTSNPLGVPMTTVTPPPPTSTTPKAQAALPGPRVDDRTRTLIALGGLLGMAGVVLVISLLFARKRYAPIPHLVEAPMWGPQPQPPYQPSPPPADDVWRPN
jgi:type VII secretion-associated serine protease mycosin